MSIRGRRSFLKALGVSAGGALLAPAISHLAGAQSQPPMRFVFVVEGNGFEPITMLGQNARAAIEPTLAAPIEGQRWWPRSYRHEQVIDVAETELSSASALTDLARSSVADQAAVLFGLSSKVVGGGHTGGHGVLSSARTLAGVPSGATIDAYLASLPQVRRETPIDVLRLGVPGSGTAALDFGTCAYGPRRAAPMIMDPRIAYQTLFGSVASDAGLAAFERRGAVLDFARTDVSAAIAAFSGGSQERLKLESYLSSVEEIVSRHERMAALAPQLGGVAPENPDTNALYAELDDPLVRLRAQLELATASLKGDLTSVVVVGSGTGGKFNLNYPALAPGLTRHDLQHGAARLTEYLEIIHEVTRLQVAAIVEMAEDLAATPEPMGEGSMLDNTVIVYISDNGEQHHSTASEFPVLLLGGRALGLNANRRTLFYPGLEADLAHRQISNLWNTLGHLAGEDLNEFGMEGPSRVAPGPLSELIG